MNPLKNYWANLYLITKSLVRGKLQNIINFITTPQGNIILGHKVYNLCIFLEILLSNVDDMHQSIYSTLIAIVLGAIVQPPSAFVDFFFLDDPLRQEISVNSDTQVTFRPTYFYSRGNLFYRNILKMTQQNQIIFIDNLPQSLAVQYSALSLTSLNFCCQSNIQNTIDKFTRIFLIDDVDCMLVTHGK